MKNFTQKYIGLFALVFVMNFTINAQEIGVIQNGGYVFHVNDDGSGLVADLQPLGEGMNWYEAIEAAENSTAQGYNDWYLPGVGTLHLMYNMLGQPENNIIGHHTNSFYWSSEETDAWYGRIYTPNSWNQYRSRYKYDTTNSSGGNDHPIMVWAIREFQFTEVFGCLNSESSNYDPYANTDDGSCVSWEEYANDLLSLLDNIIPEDGINQDHLDAAFAARDSALAEAAHNYEMYLTSLTNESDYADQIGTAIYTLTDALETGKYSGVANLNTLFDHSYAVNVLVTTLLDNQEDGVGQEDVDAAFAAGVASIEVPECEEVDTQNIPLDLPEGWSMFGYTCLESLDVIEAFSGVSDNIEIVKDELGLAYLPAWGFSAFENLEFGEGYQIKMMEAVTDFQFCTTIAGGASQEDLDAAIAEVHAMYEGWCESDLDNDGICDVDEVSGCMDQYSCNYVSEAEFDDGSCDYESCLDECGVINGDNSSCLDECGIPNGDNSSCSDLCGVPNGDNSSCLDECGIPNGDNSSCSDLCGVPNGDNSSCEDCAGIINGTSEDLGCGCGNPQATEGYDCDGNLLYYIGAEAHGGIVFYVDESGLHGLVASPEDVPGNFAWGCYDDFVDGANGTSIGTGYQNTLDILNHGCTSGHGGPTSAEAAFNYEINGYDDWFLPSKDEAYLMWSAVDDFSTNNGYGGFNQGVYMTSSEAIDDNHRAWAVGYNQTIKWLRSEQRGVRAIRSF